MREEDLTIVLKDFAKRIEYVRENMKAEEQKAHRHLKDLYKTKEELLNVIDNSVNSILSTFDAVAVLDGVIKKEGKRVEKLSDEELSKYGID